MFFQLSLEDLCMIALLLDDDDEQNHRCRRFTVHKMSKKGKIHGEFWMVFRKLMHDEQRFYQYFRMLQYDFHFQMRNVADKTFLLTMSYITRMIWNVRISTDWIR